MRPSIALVLLASSMVSSGCALLEDGTRNTVLSLRTPLERHCEWARNRRWAEAAWQEVCAEQGGSSSEDHAAGFKQGFAEYLFRGGDGQPPLVAPLHYRRLRYQTAEGHAAIQEWFDGYRHGAAVAKASGARQWITGPSSLPPPAPSPHLPLPVAKAPVGPRVPPPQFLEPMPLPLPVGAPAPVGALAAPLVDPIALPRAEAPQPPATPPSEPAPNNPPPSEPRSSQPPSSETVPTTARPLLFGLPRIVDATPEAPVPLPQAQVPLPPAPESPQVEMPQDAPPATGPEPDESKRMP